MNKPLVPIEELLVVWSSIICHREAEVARPFYLKFPSSQIWVFSIPCCAHLRMVQSSDFQPIAVLQCPGISRVACVKCVLFCPHARRRFSWHISPGTRPIISVWQYITHLCLPSLLLGEEVLLAQEVLQGEGLCFSFGHSGIWVGKSVLGSKVSWHLGFPGGRH